MCIYFAVVKHSSLTLMTRISFLATTCQMVMWFARSDRRVFSRYPGLLPHKDYMKNIGVNQNDWYTMFTGCIHVFTHKTK